MLLLQAFETQLQINGKVQKYDLFLIQEDVEQRLKIKFSSDEWENFKLKFLFYSSGIKKEIGDITLYAVDNLTQNVMSLSNKEINDYSNKWKVVKVDNHLPVLEPIVA